jgi:hypothetical protein
MQRGGLLMRPWMGSLVVFEWLGSIDVNMMWVGAVAWQRCLGAADVAVSARVALAPHSHRRWPVQGGGCKAPPPCATPLPQPRHAHPHHAPSPPPPVSHAGLQGAGSAPLYRLAAHDKATCALSFCPAVPDLLATSSTDKKVGDAGSTGGAASVACCRAGHCRAAVAALQTTLRPCLWFRALPALHPAQPRPRPPCKQVKLWSTAGGKPVQLATQNLNVGAVFSMAFCRWGGFVAELCRKLSG